MSQLGSRLGHIVHPALKTIENLLYDCHQALEANQSYNVRMDQILTVAAAEAILGCASTGRTVSSHRKPRHNNQLCRLLGLIEKNFTRPSNFDLYDNHVSVTEHGTIQLSLNEDSQITNILE